MLIMLITPLRKMEIKIFESDLILQYSVPFHSSTFTSSKTLSKCDICLCF